MRQLLLLRHAKSAWPDGVPDSQRPLNNRGRRDARAAGQWLRENVGGLGAVVCSPAQRTRETFQRELTEHGHGRITTEIRPVSEAGRFWYAEDYHQQYLHKNPGGYCNHGPNGLTCPVGVANLPAQTDILPPA